VLRGAQLFDPFADLGGAVEEVERDTGDLGQSAEGDGLPQSPSPPSVLRAPSSPVPAMIWVNASASMTSCSWPWCRDRRGFSPRRKNTACWGPQAQPARFGQGGGGGVAVVVHECRELLGSVEQRAHPRLRQRLAVGAPGPGHHVSQGREGQQWSLRSPIHRVPAGSISAGQIH
jgi:hypothetical protein